MHNNSNKKGIFPNPLAHPEVKADKQKWGLPLAWAIWTNYQMSGYKTLFGDPVLYDKYLQYAFGEQDKTKYEYKTDGDPKDTFRQFVPRIKDDIKNYATKRLRMVVDKLQNMNYDPIVDVTDSGAIDRKKDYENKLRIAMEQQKFLQELSDLTGTNQFPQGIDPGNIPVDDDDFTIDIELNYKDRIASEIEQGISYHLKTNDYETIKGDFAFYLTLIAGGVLNVYLNENNHPEIRAIRPDRAIIPECDDPYYRNIPYAGHVEYMTVHDFRLHHNGEFSKTEEELIIEQYGSQPNLPYMNNLNRNEIDPNDVHTVPVMYFEYKATNEEVSVEFTDKYGNNRFVSQDYDYYKSPGEQQKFKNKFGDKKKLHRKPYCAIYKGYWIVGSNYIYRYGLKENSVYERQGGKIGDPMLSFIVCTPGMRDGRSAGLMKQMIPVLDDLQYDNLKIQETLANPFPGGAVIDLFALRKANFTLGGKQMNPEDLIKMAFRNKLILIDTEDGNYTSGSNYQAVTELNLGIQLSDQLAILQQHLIELDEIIGYNQVTSSSPTLSDRTPVNVAQMQQENTNQALGFLFKADYFMFKQTCKMLAGLHLQAIKLNPRYYTSIFGKQSVEFLLSDNFDPDNVEYGLEIEPRPTKLEWEAFYMKLEKLENAGKLEPSDVIQIQRFTNLKKAQAYMRVLEKRRSRIEHERQLEMIEAQKKGEMERDQLKSNLIITEEQAKQNTERVKGQEERLTEMVKHRNMLLEIDKREIFEGVKKSSQIDQEGEIKVLIETIKQLGAQALNNKKAEDTASK